MKKIIILLVACLSQTFLLANPSDSLSQQKSLMEKILREEPLSITITTDLGELLVNKRKTDWQSAQLQYELSGRSYDWKMDVRPRGKFRRTVCDFPPLKLEFSKKSLGAAGLAKQDDLKLVTHCLADSLLTTQLIFREYLAYRLYNVASLQSLRVQLVKVRYEDINNKVSPFERWGILLEDIDELAERLNGEEVEQFVFQEGKLDTVQHTFIAAFQTMIGNSDWSTTPIRNLKLIKQANREELVMIPHDFDFSALVDAPYATPRPELGQKKLQQPLFQGITSSRQVLRPVLKLFQAKRKAFLKEVDDFKLLSRAERFAIQRRLREFFRMISVPEELMIYQAVGL